MKIWSSPVPKKCSLSDRKTNELERRYSVWLKHCPAVRSHQVISGCQTVFTEPHVFLSKYMTCTCVGKGLEGNRLYS